MNNHFKMQAFTKFNIEEKRNSLPSTSFEENRQELPICSCVILLKIEFCETS